MTKPFTQCKFLGKHKDIFAFISFPAKWRRSFENFVRDKKESLFYEKWIAFSLQWLHNGRDGVTSIAIVYSTVYSGADQRKHQSSASLAFVRGIHRGPGNSLHKGPVTRKMFPFDDVIMLRMTWHTRIQGISNHGTDLVLPDHNNVLTLIIWSNLQRIDIFHKSHNAPVPYPTIHRFV